jgi:hypothetical protein
MFGCRERRHMRQNLIGHAQILKQPHDFMIDGDRPRLVPNRNDPVDRKRAQACLAEQAGRNCACRPEPDDHDVKISRCHSAARADANGTANWACFKASVFGGAMPQWSARPGGQVHSDGPRTR